MLKRVKLLIGILPFCLMISVTAMAQSLQKIDVTLKNQTIKELITTIEKKTDYTFLYSNINVDAPIDIDVKGKSIQEVLNTVFKPYNISYEIKNKRIILKKGANGTTDETTDKITVKGIILDTRDEPLIGATIAIKSLPAGAVSDINGRFSLEVPRNSIISISYLGFISQKIKITDARELRIVLQENAKQLEDVVVVGYGVQKKVNLTGAVEAVGTEVFEGRSFPNTTQALQGAVSNLNISLADGKPQRTASFNVRGTTSIGQGGSALVLIDGVEGDPSLLNPNDIESVSVLKDAASAAIYGARGAFGVVLITTKSPQKGQVTVNYTGNFSFRSIAQKPEYVTDGVTYLEHYREAWWNQNGTVPVNLNGFQNYSDAWLDRMRAWKASGAEPKTEILPNGDYEHYYNMDHFGLLFKNSSFAQDHNLNISGGNEKSDFYISGRFYDFNGMYNYDPDVFSAYNLRAKGSLLATKWLRVSNSMEYSRDSYHQPLFGAAAGFISPQRCIEVTGFPTMPIYN
ncbi:MAG: SusC/RagA family TonB-linked outer membrane protein, partial [Prevotella sp.]|nr:SusC/RagA family TonB-linked outer membrane protein [Prevotella sp.]